MTFDLPALGFDSLANICLHVPRGARGGTLATVERALSTLAAHAGHKVVVARPAMRLRGIRWWLRPLRSVEWLARVAEIGQDRAAELIGGFGVRVADCLDHNAGTPRCLLGLAAAICREPAVLVYSTCGLDPSGISDVYEYLQKVAGRRCAVHVSMPAVHGDGSPASRQCVSTAHCIDLSIALFGSDGG